MTLWTIPPTVCFAGSTSQFVGPIIPPVEIVGACILEFLEFENKKPGLCNTAGSGYGTFRRSSAGDIFSDFSVRSKSFICYRLGRHLAQSDHQNRPHQHRHAAPLCRQICTECIAVLLQHNQHSSSDSGPVRLGFESFCECLHAMPSRNIASSASLRLTSPGSTRPPALFQRSNCAAAAR